MNIRNATANLKICNYKTYTMNRIILTLAILFASVSAVFAQDVIVLLNAEEIQAKVLIIGIDEITYKKWDNQEGPSYQISKAEVFYIKYANGSKDVFNDATVESYKLKPKYRPGNDLINKVRFQAYIEGGCLFTKDEAGPMLNISLGFRCWDEFFIGIKSGIDALFLAPAAGYSGFDVGNFPLMLDIRGFFPTQNDLHPYLEAALGADFMTRFGKLVYYQGQYYDIFPMTIFRLHAGMGLEYQRASVSAGYSLFHLTKKVNMHYGYVKFGIRLGKIN